MSPIGRLSRQVACVAQAAAVLSLAGAAGLLVCLLVCRPARERRNLHKIWLLSQWFAAPAYRRWAQLRRTWPSAALVGPRWPAWTCGGGGGCSASRPSGRPQGRGADLLPLGRRAQLQRAKWSGLLGAGRAASPEWDSLPPLYLSLSLFLSSPATAARLYGPNECIINKIELKLCPLRQADGPDRFKRPLHLPISALALAPGRALQNRPAKLDR